MSFFTLDTNYLNLNYKKHSLILFQNCITSIASFYFIYAIRNNNTVYYHYITKKFNNNTAHKYFVC